MAKQKVKKQKKTKKTDKSAKIKLKGPKLNKKDLKYLKNLLVKEKISLFRGMSNITNETLKKTQREASGDLSGYSYHMADMASDVYERDFLLQLASGERELLIRIDEALRRMEDGEYGFCAACGKKISKTRLKAIPHTMHCIECQEKEEKNKKKA